MTQEMTLETFKELIFDFEKIRNGAILPIFHASSIFGHHGVLLAEQ